METEAFHAYYLHKRASGESSLRVSLFTEEYGLVQALWKGARSLKKQTLLQPFTRLWLSMHIRNDWSFIKSLEWAETTKALHQDALFSGLYLNEILFCVLKPMDPHPQLYRAYEQTLQALANVRSRAALELILRRFEFHLLAFLGYGVSLTREADSANPIVASERYALTPGVGLIREKNGVLGAHLLAFASNVEEDMAVLHAIKKITRPAIAFLLDGRPLHSKSFYARLSNTNRTD